MNIWRFLTIYIAIGWAVTALGTFVDDTTNGGFVNMFNELTNGTGLSQRMLSIIYVVVMFVALLMFIISWPQLIPALPYYVDEGFKIAKNRLKGRKKSN